MRGAVRKPIELQTSHRTKAEILRRVQEQDRVAVTAEDVEKPPAWLSPAAKKEWRRVVPQLLKINVIGNLDLSSIAGYCETFAQWVAVTKELHTQDLVITTEDGRMYENPLVKLQMSYAQEMRRFSDMAGLSINARLKASATMQNKIEDEIKADFGDI